MTAAMGPSDASGHSWHRCKQGCDGCQFCDGGLSWCRLCGAAEGELLTVCPGYKLNAEALEACYTGNVRDFLRLKTYAANGYDVRRRQWRR